MIQGPHGRVPIGTAPKRTRSGTSGTSSVEFALVALVFLIAVLGTIDFARALWQWNLAARATQVGARAAIVRDPVALNVRQFDGILATPAGAQVPISALSPNPILCTAEGCGGGLATLDPALLDAAAFAGIVAAMRAYDRRIQTANVIVEYRHVGLGLAGNPAGPDLDPVVTVRLRDLRFEFLAIGFLQLPAITLPDFRASLTAEDGRGT